MRVALAARVSPETIVKILTGQPVRGDAGVRGTEACMEAGLPVPAPREEAAE